VWNAGPIQPPFTLTISVVRFVTWNLCAGDTQSKLGRVYPPPDVGVFCEVSKVLPSPSLIETAPAWEWAGRLTNRGVAIASWSEAMRRVQPWEGTSPVRYGLGVELANGVGVVGLWACPEQKGRSYGAEVHAIIDAFEPFLRSVPCVLAGDFNIAPGGDADRRVGVTKRLAELGYVSAYHAHHGVDFGDEQPTYYHRFSRGRPFHIDLVFVRKEWVPAIRSVEVAPYDSWVNSTQLRSDHVPVSVDLDLHLSTMAVNISS